MTDWFPWYPKLFEADTMHLSACQDGVYRRLIDWYMVHRRPIPDIPQAIAGIARIGLDEWLTHADVIRAFFSARGGFLHHKRCDMELDAQDRRSSRRSEIARKGAEARHRKIKDLVASSKLEASREQAASMPAVAAHAEEPKETAISAPIADVVISAPIPESRSENVSDSNDLFASSMLQDKTRQDTTTRTESSLRSDSRRVEASGLDGLFDEFWSVYPKRPEGNPRKPAKERFTAAIKRGVDPQAIIMAALAYARQRQGEESRYTVTAAVWLRQERWTEAHERRDHPNPAASGRSAHTGRADRAIGAFARAVSGASGAGDALADGGRQGIRPGGLDAPLFARTVGVSPGGAGVVQGPIIEGDFRKAS